MQTRKKNAANEGYAKLVELGTAPHARALIVLSSCSAAIEWWISTRGGHLQRAGHYAAVIERLYQGATTVPQRF